MHPQILGTWSQGRHWLLETATWLRIMEKAICFYKIDPKELPKRIGNKISMIFSSCTCKRQDDQNWYSWSNEMRFLNLFLELAAYGIRHTDNIFIKPKMLALR